MFFNLIMPSHKSKDKFCALTIWLGMLIISSKRLPAKQVARLRRVGTYVPLSLREPTPSGSCRIGFGEQ